MEKMHQQISIDLTLDGQSSPWCNIKHQTGKTGEKTYVFGPQTLIGMYENGKRSLPIEHLKTLAKFYKVSTDYILGLTNKK